MKNDFPLVSIAITTYNRAHLLSRCLNGVIKQKYSNIEIIIVDDHSTDDTEQRIKQYLKHDKRIKYVRHKKNLGNAHARNTALKNCIGKYVAFIDDDDEWIDPNKLIKQVSIFESSDKPQLGIICSNVNIISDKKTSIKTIKEPKNIKKAILFGNSIIFNSTVLTKRDILLTVKGFDVNLSRGIDSDFFRNFILKQKGHIYFMPDVTINYYEMGTDRITLLTSKKAILNHINSNMYCIKKYFRYFLKYPSTLIYRILRIGKAVLKLFIVLIKSQFKIKT